MLTDSEIRAWVLGEVVLAEAGNAEVLPVSALTPVGKLAEFNQGVSITCPVIIKVPVSEDSDSGKTNIGTNDSVSEEDPRSDDRFIARKKFSKTIR